MFLTLGLVGGFAVMLTSAIGECYCAFCKSTRKYFLHKSLRAIHYVQASFLSVFFMYVFWQTFDARVFLILAALLVATEMLLVLRWRIYIVCSKCGFDPVLYMKDPDTAARRVSEFMQKYETEPQFELLPSPKRNLHHRRVPAKVKSNENLSGHSNL